ncbi:peptidase S14 [Rhizobium lentis]|uniref:peptidase S14 n=1 Tax=Rhizobium lentis TaxID=1138194 RepID=UPI001C831866|nr:peptidase S14 [Rhizobium lentis]MBX5130794.1 peptidase S14 [Rhizobium lentis]
MSVVVYHKGVMAADSRAYSGSTHPVGNKRKIHRMPDGSLLGITSNQIGMPEAFAKWISEGASRDASVPAEASLTALHVLPNGDVYLYSDGYTPSGPLSGDTFTIGSGRKYALGAIEMGADAARAVEAAIAHDLWCGGPVAVLALHELQP